MNIEQNSNMQELTEEEYTKVYAGMMSYELFPERTGAVDSGYGACTQVETGNS